MKPILLVVALSFLLTAINAQTNETKFIGTVKSQNVAIEAATVQLLKAKDSSIAKIGLTLKDGSFEISTSLQGNFILCIISNGYVKQYSAIYTANNETINVASFNLTQTSKELANVTVISKKPMVEQKLDRMIVNVEASASNVGANALEVLEKSPGVTVDKDGNISLKGKAGTN